MSNFKNWLDHFKARKQLRLEAVINRIKYYQGLNIDTVTETKMRLERLNYCKKLIKCYKNKKEKELILCQVCKKSIPIATRYDRLIEHVTSCHLHLDVFKCMHCEYQCKLKCNLHTHLKSQHREICFPYRRKHILDLSINYHQEILNMISLCYKYI